MTTQASDLSRADQATAMQQAIGRIAELEAIVDRQRGEIDTAYAAHRMAERRVSTLTATIDKQDAALVELRCQLRRGSLLALIGRLIGVGV